MHKSRRAVSGNMVSKVVFGLTAVLLLFAPPTARSGGAAEVFDFQICGGYFALCAASTCTPTGMQITVKTATGGAATFPEADCTCPVLLGPSIANLAGGNTVDLPAAQDIVCLAVHDEDAGRPVGAVLAAAAERADVDAFRTAVVI